MKKMKKEDLFKHFIKKYEDERYMGKLLGEGLFESFFGYLHPVKPFDELTIGEVQFLIEGELKSYKRKI